MGGSPMDKRLVCYWASELAVLCITDKGAHLTRIQDGKGLPTDDEIHNAKEQLDRAYQSAE